MTEGTGLQGAGFGVCILPAPPPNAARTTAYPGYLAEILAHAGVCREDVAADSLADALPGISVLLTVGEAVIAPDTAQALRAWVAAGGAWIAVAGTLGCADLLGVETIAPGYAGFGAGTGTLGEGYLYVEEALHPALQPIRRPLHYFNGVPVRGRDCAVLARALDVHGHATDRAAMTERTVGAGKCILIAPDLTGAVVRIQQGIGVTRDGVPASDGTAPVADQVLKSGDGAVLDWILDREPVANEPGFLAYQTAVADEWRDLLLRTIFALAGERGILLPVLWLYPRGLPALGHLSHDTDGNDPAAAEAMLKTLAEAGAPGTWCVIPPGYDRALIESIRAAGHELAMHFDAMSEGTQYTEEEFDAQFRLLASLLDEAPTSNKNHYLRWEGDCELFDWCVDHGIRIDESKGASKTGEAGFNFGTCHPYFPVRFDGEPIDVLELCTPTQDLLVFAPETLRDPLLSAAMRHHGVAHFLFHPAHIMRPGVADALKETVRAGRARGMEWWTAAQIDAWERARRSVRWLVHRQDGGRLMVEIAAGADLADASLLFLGESKLRWTLDAEPGETRECVRWGMKFQRLDVTLEAGKAFRIELDVLRFDQGE